MATKSRKIGDRAGWAFKPTPQLGETKVIRLPNPERDRLEQLEKAATPFLAEFGHPDPATWPNRDLRRLVEDLDAGGRWKDSLAVEAYADARPPVARPPQRPHKATKAEKRAKRHEAQRVSQAKAPATLPGMYGESVAELAAMIFPVGVEGTRRASRGMRVDEPSTVVGARWSSPWIGLATLPPTQPWHATVPPWEDGPPSG